MPQYAQVILKRGKEEPLRRKHPWVFSGAIDKIHGVFKEGDFAEVFSNNQEYLATGYLLSGSIAVKLVSYERRDIDKEFWKEKFIQAYSLRAELGLVTSGSTNAYRLVHNEGDGFPGLIVDIYSSLAVVQCHSVGMYQLRSMFSELLQEILTPSLTAVYDKSSETLKKMTGFRVANEFLFGSKEEHKILENRHSFLVNPAQGQKTGFFLDQRDNRQLLSVYANQRHVLNMFGYTGGFSVYAAAAGADRVITVDSSAPAIDMSIRNVALNNIQSGIHQGIVADAKRYLDTIEKGSFDLIILDPPAYAKTMDSKKKALMGYRMLNARALQKIGKNGILFTFSCSQVVDRQMFLSAVTAASIDVGRRIQILHQLSHPPDHPVSIFHQEGEYLKGLVLRVE